VAVTSTVLDAAVALLCVSAAVGAVVTAGAGAGPGVDGGFDATGRSDAPARADRLAGTLATSTGSVNYTLAPGAQYAEESLVAFPQSSGAAFQRRDRGTLAALFARAAVRDVTVDGDWLTHAHVDYTRAVRTAVETAATDPRFQAVAVWQPYPGTHVGGRVTAGRPPPPNATVHAATLTLPSGAPSARESARNATDGGFSAVATVVAEHLVVALFPPDRSRQALQDDYPVAALTAYRYRRAGQRYGVDVSGPLADERAGAANRRLVGPVAAAVERDLRARFSDPQAAARSVRLDTVRIVVRTWSA
jgi:hypothetical protein